MLYNVIKRGKRDDSNDKSKMKMSLKEGKELRRKVRYIKFYDVAEVFPDFS